MNKRIKKFWKKVKKDKLLYKYMLLLIALFVASLNYNLFLRPLKIVAGGTNGLSLLVEKYFSISPFWFILSFSVIVLVVSFFTLGIRKTSSALVATFVYPFFVSLTEPVTGYVNVSGNDVIIATIFAGILSGIVSGLICKVDLSQGGTVLISQILYDKFKISIGRANFFINLVIILIGGYSFGITTVLYAIILLYISSVILDIIMLGVSGNKTFYIITNKNDAIREYITNDLDSGVTIFNAKDNDDEEKSVLMASVSNEHYYKFRKNIKKIDKDAFFVTTDSYEVNGGRNN